MTPILAMIRKDLKLLLRDRASAFFAFVFPVLFAIFFGTVFSGGGGGGGGNALQIAEAAKKAGINDLRASALKKVRDGLTSLAEINRVTKD